MMRRAHNPNGVESGIRDRFASSRYTGESRSERIWNNRKKRESLKRDMRLMKFNLLNQCDSYPEESKPKLMRMEYGRDCRNCGLSFVTSHPRKVYCCSDCRYEYHRKLFIPASGSDRICFNCGKSFYGMRKAIHCSFDCRSEANKNYKRKKARKPRRAKTLRYLAGYLRREGVDYTANNVRKLRVKRAGKMYSRREFSELCKSYGNRCLCCGVSASEAQGGKLTADHVIPLAKGGGNHIGNIQPLCGRCNSVKGTKCTDYRLRVSGTMYGGKSPFNELPTSTLDSE